MNTNTPYLLASVALLAGVAARPIDNDHRATRDDLREIVRSPDSDDRQAFLGHIPSGFDSLNSLQLHDIHDNANTNAEAEENASRSPKLSGTDPTSDPDPGLDSPYMGPQRHLASIEHELASSSDMLTPEASSPPARKTEEPRLSSTPLEPEYSRTVVILVFASLAALVLLGLTVAVVGVTQLLRRTVFRQEVWNSVAGGRNGEKKHDVSGSENEKVEQGHGDAKSLLEGGGSETGAIAAREIPSGVSRSFPVESTKSSEASVDDPDIMPLPEMPSPSAPAVRDRQRTMGLALAPWAYDNWITHLMMALFGWFGVFFGGAGDRR